MIRIFESRQAKAVCVPLRLRSISRATVTQAGIVARNRGRSAPR